MKTIVVPEPEKRKRADAGMPSRDSRKAKNSKYVPVVERANKSAITRFGLVGGGTESYDKDIWDGIVKSFCKEHDLDREAFYKIVAFCFPEWGARSWSKQNRRFMYSLNEEAILDSSMGWKVFKQEIGKAIRLTKKHLPAIDRLWVARRKYETGAPPTVAEETPSSMLEEAYTKDSLDVVEPASGSDDFENIAYGIFNDGDDI